MLSSTARERTWPVLSSKPVRLLASTLFSLIAILFWIHFYTGTSAPPVDVEDVLEAVPQNSTVPEYRKGRLHLLIPATSTNDDLCKLLLSAQILGYPTPVLINYGDKEDKEDAYKQHLGKVEGILNYLNHIEQSDEYAEDLVLIIDGFDVWFQLRPDVLIKRYYDINVAADARSLERYGQELVDEHDIRQTVVFGPDKICWPVDFSRPACWAVLQGTFPDDTFGPKSTIIDERDKNTAVWLNSGTVMGPAKDMREVFRATLEDIKLRYKGDSDQYYFANIFGDQEYARLSRVPLLKEAILNKSMSLLDWEDNSQGYRFEPPVEGRKTEYHIGIDYSSSMFQTLAFWRQHLSWLKMTDIWTPPARSPYPSNNPYAYELPEDIASSRPPYASLDHLLDNSTEERGPVWSEVLLSYNSVTQQIPVVLHVTGNPREKGFRKYWWSKIWFQQHAQQLRTAAMEIDQRKISEEPINGMWWFVAEGEEEDTEELKKGGLGGVWTDRRGWLSWKRMCRRTEGGIFNVDGDESFHPRVKWPPEPEPELEPEPEMQFEPVLGDTHAEEYARPPPPPPVVVGELADDQPIPFEQIAGVEGGQVVPLMGVGYGSGEESAPPVVVGDLGGDLSPFVEGSQQLAHSPEPHAADGPQNGVDQPAPSSEGGAQISGDRPAVHGGTKEVGSALGPAHIVAWTNSQTGSLAQDGVKEAMSPALGKQAGVQDNSKEVPHAAPIAVDGTKDLIRPAPPIRENVERSEGSGPVDTGL